MTYAEGSTFEGVFNGERIKEGIGKYTWMKPAEEDGEDPQVRPGDPCHCFKSEGGTFFVMDPIWVYCCEGRPRDPFDPWLEASVESTLVVRRARSLSSKLSFSCMRKVADRGCWYER